MEKEPSSGLISPWKHNRESSEMSEDVIEQESKYLSQHNLNETDINQFKFATGQSSENDSITYQKTDEKKKKRKKKKKKKKQQNYQRIV